MRLLPVAIATVLLITSTSVGAWWDNWKNNNGGNNSRYYNQNNGQYNGQYYNNADGDTSGDGSIGFKGDIRFKIKMKNRGNARMDAYYYDNQGNVWQSNGRNGGYYYNRYDPYYSQPYYGPGSSSGYGYPARPAQVR